MRLTLIASLVTLAGPIAGASTFSFYHEKPNGKVEKFSVLQFFEKGEKVAFINLMSSDSTIKQLNFTQKSGVYIWADAAKGGSTTYVFVKKTGEVFISNFLINRARRGDNPTSWIEGRCSKNDD